MRKPLRRQMLVGFTIVELLIVIVVISILATISIVAYSGIQNRSYDVAIQSDIKNLVKKIRLYEAENGKLPAAGSHTLPLTARGLPGINFSPSKQAYDLSTNNLYYCDGLVSGSPSFTIVSRSKSKTTFTYRPSEGIATVSSGISSVCLSGFDAGSDGYSYGFYSTLQEWNYWID